MSSKKRVLSALLAAGIGALCMSVTMAAVSPEEAKLLGTTLTEFGAEKAGNADGSIPAYTGGLHDKNLALAENPYKDEKPLYSVDAKNMAQYAAMLTEGTKTLMSRYPDYRIDVYPTHRGMRYPAWVLENTIKNATTAKLGGPVKGDNLLGAGPDGLPFPGVPFPIPKDGYEVMWNNTAKYAPPISHLFWSGYLVDTAGKISNLPHLNGWYVHPRYDRSGELQKLTPEGTQFGFNAMLTDPPSSAGIVFLNFYTSKGEEGGQKVWFYTPGQRRVRMAPEFAYDVPIASYGGATIWDEIYSFVGRLDRFDFKLVGKKEMLVPYNIYLFKKPNKEVFKTKFVNPDVVRWEKHRVWVVEATRKPGSRHVYSRRTFYIDEDSWCNLVHESYDDAGKIYRATSVYTNPNPQDMGGINHLSWQTYDLIKGNYFILGMLNGPGDGITNYETPKGLNIPLTPNAVAAGGVR